MPTEWIRFDVQRPPHEGMKVWAYTVGCGPMCSMLEPGVIVDCSNLPPLVEVLKSYSTVDGSIRINCSAARRVTHWMPYSEPLPPAADLHNDATAEAVCQEAEKRAKEA